MEKRQVYLDHGATTPVREEVLEVMLPYFKACYANPSSLHSPGQVVRQEVEKARLKVAEAFRVKPEEIFFTGSGTESNNIALKGVAARQKQGGHIITSSVEHHAVFTVCQALQEEGFQVTYLPVDSFGRVSPESLRAAIRPDTFLISVMAANNEIGTIQPVAEIGKIAAENNIIFHCDAVQAAGQVPLDLTKTHCDLLSLSAHKFNGPKGVGALYIRQGTKIKPLLAGGGQEQAIRPGTENVPGIIGMAKALELAVLEMDEKKEKLTALRDRLIKGLLEIDEVRLNGHPKERLPGNVNVSFQHIEGESILLSLDLQGVAASSGSACSSGSSEPSHVLSALGLDHQSAHGSIRFSLGLGSTDADIDYVLKIMPGIVERLRLISPTYKPKAV